MALRKDVLYKTLVAMATRKKFFKNNASTILK